MVQVRIMVIEDGVVSQNDYCTIDDTVYAQAEAALRGWNVANWLGIEVTALLKSKAESR